MLLLFLFVLLTSFLINLTSFHSEHLFGVLIIARERVFVNSFLQKIEQIFANKCLQIPKYMLY